MVKTRFENAAKRSGSGPAAKGAQQTLSFGGSNSKVTKQGVVPVGKGDGGKAKGSALKNEVVVKDEDIVEPALVNIDETKHAEVGGHLEDFYGGEVDLDVHEPAFKSEELVPRGPINVAKKLGEKEEAALERAQKVTEAQIKKYWRERESERRTKRVHQEELGVEERVCRLFDVESRFGPCIGITRTNRWLRAERLGLNPPIEVLAILVKDEEKKGNAKAVSGAGNKTMERAYIDELMSSRFVVGGDA